MSDWINQNQIFINLPVNQLLAITAFGEAGNQGTEGMMAVLNVINNRAANILEFADPEIMSVTNSPFHGVILKHYQFSMYNLDDPVRANAIKWAQNFNQYLLQNTNFKKAFDLANMLRTGQLEDNTKGATFYHADYVTPYWASSIPFIGQIGNHLFYGYEKKDMVYGSLIFVGLLGLGIWLFLRRKK